MILTLMAAVLLSVLVVWFVLSPLFSAQNMEVFSSSYKGFSDETELRQVLLLRDQLVERLSDGRSSDERISALSESECFDALVSLCLRLHRAELPFLPESGAPAAEKRASEGGFVRVGLLLSLVILGFVISGVARISSALAQEVSAPASVDSQAPHPKIRPEFSSGKSLHILEPFVFLPTSNRYIVSPSRAELIAHHVSSFAVPTTLMSQFRIVMAVPESIYDWQIVDLKPESLAKVIKIVEWNGLPAIEFPPGIQGLSVSVSSEFRLGAASGRAVWKNDKLYSFPGEQVAILFEIPGVLKQIFGPIADNWNVWPPRISQPGPSAQVISREVTMGPNSPPKRVQLINRSGEGGLPFLQFEVIGLVPSRTPLILLGALVGAVLFGVTLTLFTRRVRWRIDTPESLPR